MKIDRKAIEGMRSDLYWDIYWELTQSPKRDSDFEKFKKKILDADKTIKKILDISKR